MDKFNDDKEEFKGTVNELYEKGKEAASDAYNSTKEKAESLTDQVKDTVSDLYDKSKKKINILEDYLDDYSNELVKKVKDKPLTSLLIAGSIGFILSKLWRK